MRGQTSTRSTSDPRKARRLVGLRGRLHTLRFCRQCSLRWQGEQFPQRSVANARQTYSGWYALRSEDEQEKTADLGIGDVPVPVRDREPPPSSQRRGPPYSCVHQPDAQQQYRTFHIGYGSGQVLRLSIIWTRGCEGRSRVRYRWSCGCAPAMSTTRPAGRTRDVSPST